jgi:hypothetical protein
VFALSATPVDAVEVIETWVAHELGKRDDPGAVDGDLPFAVNEDWRARLSTGEKEQLLDAVTDGPAEVFWEHAPVDWYRATLSRAAFRRLRAPQWPEWVGWGTAAAPDGRLATVARRVREGESFEYVDGEYVRELAAAGPWPVSGALVTLRQVPGDPPAMIDGTHRATAGLARLCRGGRYVPTTAYVGLKRASLGMALASWVGRLRR